MNDEKPWLKSEKFQAARDEVPEELQGIFEQLVEEYRFATMKRYGNGYVAYVVLADLIKDGWRPPKSK